MTVSVFRSPGSSTGKSSCVAPKIARPLSAARLSGALRQLFRVSRAAAGELDGIVNETIEQAEHMLSADAKHATRPAPPNTRSMLMLVSLPRAASPALSGSLHHIP